MDPSSEGDRCTGKQKERPKSCLPCQKRRKKFQVNLFTLDCNVISLKAVSRFFQNGGIHSPVAQSWIHYTILKAHFLKKYINLSFHEFDHEPMSSIRISCIDQTHTSKRIIVSVYERRQSYSLYLLWKHFIKRSRTGPVLFSMHGLLNVLITKY